MEVRPPYYTAATLLHRRDHGALHIGAIEGLLGQGMFGQLKVVCAGGRRRTLLRVAGGEEVVRDERAQLREASGGGRGVGVPAGRRSPYVSGLMRRRGLVAPHAGHQAGEGPTRGRRRRWGFGQRAAGSVGGAGPLRGFGFGAGLSGPLAVHAAVSSHQGRAGETLAARVANIGSLPSVGSHVAPQVPRANERLPYTDM